LNGLAPAEGVRWSTYGVYSRLPQDWHARENGAAPAQSSTTSSVLGAPVEMEWDAWPAALVREYYLTFAYP
jgi:hypothetical protein